MARDVDFFMEDTTYGLLPYLDAQIGGTWNRFIVRVYNVGTNSSGWCVEQRSSRSLASGNPRSQVLVTATIQVGKYIGFSAIADQSQASVFAGELDRTIRHWAGCKCPSLYTGSAEEIQIPLGLPKQNTQVSSGAPGAWWLPVVARFDILFLDNA